MCGINGFTWQDKTLIQAMNNVTRYRGPDGSGIYMDEKITLGHSRLSIIDLSDNGFQPMTNADSSILITYNGEIYNFQDIREDLQKKGRVFKSTSDTEVILYAYEMYGLDCLKQFNGMWAFGLYDKNKDLLILCRDRFGIKPLYYYLDKEKLVFSSMITSILTHQIETAPNDQAIMQYLAFNLNQHNDQTFFRSICSLKPGNVLIYNLKTREHCIEQWYTPHVRENENDSSLRELFIDGVKLWTVSDVPVGVSLSGGIDSTAITCVLNQHLTYKFDTFSLIASGSSVDESKYIREVGRVTNSIQHYTEVNADDFLTDMDEFVAAMEEPVGGLSTYGEYIVFKLAHECGAKVLLGGQGGDELFAGYIYYFGYYFYELFRQFKWGKLIKEMILYLQKIKNLFPHALFAFLLLPDSLRNLVWKKKITPWLNHNLLEEVCGEERDPRWKRMDLKESMEMTLFITSIPHLLLWEDKTSMRWSVESRVPFMDFRLVETAISLSSEKLLRDGETKYIFRESIEDILPEMIRNRKDKIGFEVPSDDLFRSLKVISLAKEIIYSESFKKRPYWNWSMVEKIFLDHINGKTNEGELIWKWIILELWLRTYFEKV